jgi:uncharacterized Zn finger protein (UPF0148 family)
MLEQCPICGTHLRNGRDGDRLCLNPQCENYAGNDLDNPKKVVERED